MHTVISALIPLAAYLAIEVACDRWNKRPAVRARLARKMARMSLRGKIARMIRLRVIACAIQAGFLALAAGLRLSGHLSFAGWLTTTIVSGFYLTVHLWLLHAALGARRAYNDLGGLAYLAEIQHAFGTSQPAQSPDVTAHNLAVLKGSRPVSDQSEH